VKKAQVPANARHSARKLKNAEKQAFLNFQRQPGSGVHLYFF
jgi:hypothetical protein